MANFFTGTITALITPFTDDNKIDFRSLEKIIEAQIEGGVEGLLFAGTTGESPTLTAKERDELFRTGIEIINNRAYVVLGTGTNNTANSIENAKLASKFKADAQLVVNPYYNKPTQKGLYEHFTAIANASDLPIIMYNIKGRTGVNIETETLLKLAEHKNIRAVKEASGDISQMMDVLRKVPKDFSVLIGDDVLVYPFMACGGHGLISVVSNILPKTCSEMVRLCLDEEWETARSDFYAMLDIMNAMFLETNPIPLKETMALLGYCKPIFRLPMSNAEPKTIEKLKSLVGAIRKMEQ